MNRQEALRIVGTLAAAHPAWKASEATVELWCDMLADLPYDDTAAAVRGIIGTSNDWPSVAAVRQAVARRHGLLGPDVDEACRQFLARASGRPTQTHPWVEQTVAALGGWHHVRHGSNVSVLVGQFRSLYETGASRETSAVLTGDVGLQLEAQTRPELEGGAA